MAKHTIYCTRQSRYEGERVMPGDEITVDDREMSQLMSSGRFTTDKELAPKKKPKGEPKKTPAAGGEPPAP